MILSRLRHYPPSFVAQRPLRVARNLVGNHPSRLANRYLAGLRGIEIGAASYNRWFLDTVNVDYSDVADTRDMQLAFAGHVVPVDVVAEAWELPFPDGSYDFVLASHVLEHIPDPIGALREWVRVASRYVFVVLPQPDYQPYDRKRELTSVEELVERHRGGPGSGEHDDGWRGHWSRWSSASFAELCARLDIAVVDVQDPDDKRGNGFAVVLDATPRATSGRLTPP
jgi:SAM-dependent methyltransferase